MIKIINTYMIILKKSKKLKATPTGTYVSVPNADLYGYSGFNMNPVPAFGQPAPRAKALAQHVIYGAGPKGSHGYDPQEAARRTKIMEGPGENRVGSFGCTNMYGKDINCLTGELFPKGDTTIVVDSRRPADQSFLKILMVLKKWVVNLVIIVVECIIKVDKQIG